MYAIAVLDSPIGDLLLVATEQGVLQVGFDTDDNESALRQLTRLYGSPQRTLPVLDQARQQLDEYFSGQRTSFEVALDHSLSRGFRAQALIELAKVPYGTTLSYTALATAAGRPTAVRAAASACATNPIPLLVPCHRVLRADGSLGGFRGGMESKRWLLELEKAA